MRQQGLCAGTVLGVCTCLFCVSVCVCVCVCVCVSVSVCECGDKEGGRVYELK